MVLLVLASASPRRTDLLEQWGIPHEVVPADVDEDVASHDAPRLTEHLARSKAAAVFDGLEAAGRPDLFVLGADTIVARGDTLLGKPQTPAEALSMLKSISGQDVDVVTGVAVFASGAAPVVSHDRSVVTMRSFSEAEARAYVETGEPFGKAGAFAVQGKGGALVERVEGSFSNVVGLPRALVFELLEQSGFPLGPRGR